MKYPGIHGIIEHRDMLNLFRLVRKNFLAPRKGAREGGNLSMKKYELAVVVNAKIDDEERAAVVDKCKALIERFGGTITNVDDWGKKRLAYEVQKMKEAFYYFIQFDAETTAPIEIENRVRIMDNVIRFLCVKQEA